MLKRFNLLLYTIFLSTTLVFADQGGSDSLYMWTNSDGTINIDYEWIDAKVGTEILNYGIVYFPSAPEVTKTNGIVSIVMKNKDPTAFAGATIDSFDLVLLGKRLPPPGNPRCSHRRGAGALAQLEGRGRRRTHRDLGCRRQHLGNDLRTAL